MCNIMMLFRQAIFGLALISCQALSAEISARKCQLITVPMCKNMPYESTSMPNYFNHTTQEEASLDISQFQALFRVNCSADLKFFLCSMHTPICIDNYPMAIPACRSVCVRVREGCSRIMKKFGFDWPETMACEKMPEMSTDRQLCMDPWMQQHPDVAIPEYPQSYEHGNIETVVSYPKSPPSPDLVDIGVERGKADQCSCRKCGDGTSLNSVVQLPASSSQWFVRNVSFGGLDHCAVPCHSPFFDNFSSNEAMLEAVLTLLSFLCLACSLISVVSLWGDVESFEYPERSILYFNGCYAVIACGFLIRIMAGHKAVACQSFQFGDQSAVHFLAKQGLSVTDSNPVLCPLVFVCIYYFSMAACMWWLVHALTWFLSAGLSWAIEALARISQWLHLLAWGVPLVELVAIFWSDAIEADPISGICFVGAINSANIVNFIIIPVTLKLVLGLALMTFGIVSYLKFSRILPLEERQKAQNLVSTLVTLTLFYAVPMGVLLACSASEVWNAQAWQETVVCRDCLKDDGLALSAPNFDLFLLKYCMLLASGIISVFWVFGRVMDSIMAIVSRTKNICGIFGRKKIMNGDCAVQSESVEVVHLANMNLVNSVIVVNRNQKTLFQQQI